jgi:thiol-disulfide isomerase/thioredoxin
MPVKDSSSIVSREDYISLIKNNKHVIVVKFGAEWCKPCKQIETYVNEFMSLSNDNVDCYVIDIDNAFDVYGYLKSKKIVTSIPTILMYTKDEPDPLTPHDVLIGTDVDGIKNIFQTADNWN